MADKKWDRKEIRLPCCTIDTKKMIGIWYLCKKCGWKTFNENQGEQLDLFKFLKNLSKPL